MNQELSDLFAGSQAILTLSEDQKKELFEKILQLPVEGQQAIIDILKQENVNIDALKNSLTTEQEVFQLAEKRNKVIAIENVLKHQVMNAREQAEVGNTDADQLLNQLN